MWRNKATTHTHTHTHAQTENVCGNFCYFFNGTIAELLATEEKEEKIRL